MLGFVVLIVGALWAGRFIGLGLDTLATPGAGVSSSVKSFCGTDLLNWLPTDLLTDPRTLGFFLDLAELW